MLFTEQKLEKGYKYACEDVFGNVELTSSIKLSKETVDEIVTSLIFNTDRSKVLQGEVKNAGASVQYKLERVVQWTKDKEVCKDTPTSTKRQANGFIQISRWLKKVLNWPMRFVEAFLEAWKKSH